MGKVIAAAVLASLVSLPAPGAGWTHKDTGITSIIVGAGLMLGTVSWSGCGDGFKAEHHAEFGGPACLYTRDTGEVEVYNPSVGWHPGKRSMYMLIAGANMIWVGALLTRLPDNPVTNVPCAKYLYWSVKPGTV